MNCKAPGCPRDTAGGRQLCPGHSAQKARGQKLRPLGIPRGNGRAVSPEKLDLYQRVAAESETGNTIAQQAAVFGVSRRHFRKLRENARLQGFDVTPATRGHGPAIGAKYDTVKREAALAASVPRCRCGLALPCNGCLPTIADLASSRRGDSAGFGA